MSELNPGDILGPYRLAELLGAGGMGNVYRAVHEGLDRSVALKVVHAHLIDEHRNRQRFLREAQLMSDVHHPNVVRLLDFGETRGVLFLAMELLTGSPLGDLIRGRKLPPDLVLPLARDLASGVAALHAGGILHRDIKPQNLFITGESRLKVMDLGLARTANQTALTAQGLISGTLSYLPPELVNGAPHAPTGDIFQIGLVLHEMVTGVHAFEEPPFRYMLAGTGIPPPRILTLSHPHPDLERVVMRCLSPDPIHRYQDGNELALSIGAAGSTGGARLEPSPLPSGPGRVRAPVEAPTEVSPAPARVIPDPRPSLRLPARPAGRGWVGPAALAGLGLILGILAVGRERPAPASTSPVQSQEPPARKEFPAGVDLLDLSGTVALEDQVFPGPDGEKQLLEDSIMAPFREELERSLQEIEVKDSVRHNQVMVEYWPDPPVAPGLARGIRLIPALRSGQAIAPTGLTTGPVRRIVMRLRPDEPYRLESAGERPVELRSPIQRLGRDLTLSPGPGSVLVSLYPVGKYYRILSLRRSDRTLLEPAPSSRQGLADSRFDRYIGIHETDEITLFVLSSNGRERFVWARVPWRPTPRRQLQAALDLWQKNVDEVARGIPTRAAELRLQADLMGSIPAAGRESGEELKNLVNDGCELVFPQVVVRARTLLGHRSTGIRKGAVDILGMLGAPSDLAAVRSYAARHLDPEEWIHGMQALGRLGDARARQDLLAALDRGQVRWQPPWPTVYLRCVPGEVLARLAGPGAAGTEVPPGPRARLLDAVAACLPGPAAAPYLLGLPARRLAGQDGFPAVLALRLLDTAESRRRLQAVARELGLSGRSPR